MIANYHTHTWRCMHAAGTEREYVEAGIAGGLKILGFSDHTPQPYPEGYVSNTKMTMDQLEDYVDTVLKLKEEYKNDIEIHLGLETEYYPRMFEELLACTGQYPIEYFLLGQHCLGNEIHDVYAGERTEEEKRLERYCIQCEEAMATGCFSYLAHPDLMHFTGAPEIYDRWMRRLCESARRMDIPLEINFLGIRMTRNYPNPRFWKIAGETGNQVIFGSDAHRPEEVWSPRALARAEEMVKSYGLNLIETVDFRRPVLH